MPIEFRCPHCKQQMRVPDAAAGKNARCPKCSKVVGVPQPAAASAPPLPMPPPPPPPVAQPNFAFGQSPPAKSSFDFGQSAAPQRPAPPQPSFNFGQPAASPPLPPPLPPPPPPPPPPSPLNFGQPVAHTAPQPAFGSGQSPPPLPSAGFGSPSPNPFASNDLGPSFGGNDGGGGSSATLNPYASPAAIADRPMTGYYGAKDIHYTKVEAGPILNWALKVWQDNLGMLLGVTFIYVVLVAGVQFATQALQGAILFRGEPALMFITSLGTWLINTALQVFLNIGMTQICLKMARQQRADFTDLFGGGGKFLPVFGFYVLVYVGSLVVGGVIGFTGVMLAQAAGDVRSLPIIFVGLGGLAAVAFLFLVLVYWPIQTLLIDTRIKFGPVFGVAEKVTRGNRLTGFVLILLIFGLAVLAAIIPFTVMLIGGQQFSLAIMFMAFAIGGLEALFLMPLVFMLWAVAYLMMTGQIPQRPELQKQIYR